MDQCGSSSVLAADDYIQALADGVCKTSLAEEQTLQPAPPAALATGGSSDTPIAATA
jgi:hypothetical protein